MAVATLQSVTATSNRRRAQKLVEMERTRRSKERLTVVILVGLDVSEH